MRVHSDQKWLWGVVLAMPIAFATVAPLHVPLWLTVGLWSIYPVVIVFAVLSLIPRYRQLHARKSERPLMGILVAMFIGATVGACSAAVIWNWQQPDDENSTGTTLTRDEAKPTLPAQPTADDLDLVFRTSGLAINGDTFKILQLSPSVATNRSEKNMSLSFNLALLRGDEWIHFLGFWDGSADQQQPGMRVINLTSHQSADGRVVFYFPTAKQIGVELNKIDGKNSVLEIFDRVTGKTVGCQIGIGYPPSVKFPYTPDAKWNDVVTSHPAQLKAAFDSIERTSNASLPLKYMAWGTSRPTINEGTPQAQDIVHIDAEFVNRSDKNMSLSFILLLKFPTKNGSLHTTGGEGEWKEKLNDELTSILNLPRESTVKGHLVFRLVSIKQLKELYKDIEFGVDKWADVKGVVLALRIEDKVSGVFVLSDAQMYPSKEGWSEEWKKGL